MPEGRRERWERRADVPLSVGALVFLIGYAVPTIWPHVSEPTRWVCHKAVLASWIFFAFDYVFRLVVARHKLKFVRTHVFDLVVVAFPMLRPLRVLRVVTLLGVLNRYAVRSARFGAEIYIALAVVVIVFTASLAELNAERRSPDANIKTFGTAVWWAVSTITTVGYGDHYPVTTQGRIIAACLMISGIALLGIVTASLAAWMLNEVRHIEEDEEAVTRGDLKQLHKEVRALRREIRRLSKEESTRAGPP